jgi:hypothetical protein
MNEAVAKIRHLIEEARAAGALGNDQARAASVALGLEGNDALLACRLIAQGPDPASLDYLDTGEVAPKIMDAHRSGPGVFKGDDPELNDYLALCAMSCDESQGALDSVRGRFYGFFRAMQRMENPDEEFKAAAMEQLGRAERERIQGLSYSVATVGGRSMRVYQSDRGFAAAAWDGESCAAVLGTYDGKPYLSIGAPPYCETLEDQGVKVDKALSPRFGIVESEAEVARVVEETGLEV